MKIISLNQNISSTNRSYSSVKQCGTNMINNTDGNFKVFGCDTDSIIFSKRDGSEISEQEQQSILDKVNSLFPDKIKFEDDGYYPSVIVFKAKNYVLFGGN